MVQYGANYIIMPRPKVGSRVVRLSVSIDESAYADLCSLTDSLGVSAAWAVRRAVTEWLEQHRRDLPLQRSLLPVGTVVAADIEPAIVSSLAPSRR